MSADREKERKYRAMASECGAEFVPLVFDAFGGWSPTTRRFLDRCRKSRESSAATPRAFTAMKQEISVAIHRFNGKALWRGTCASTKQQVDDSSANGSGSAAAGLGLGLGLGMV